LAGTRGASVRNQAVNSRIGRLTTCRRARRYPMRRKLFPRSGISLQPAECDAVMAGTTVKPKPETHELENAGELIGLEYAMEFRSTASTGSEHVVTQAVTLFE
jgi:hypothetical protein